MYIDDVDQGEILMIKQFVLNVFMLFLLVSNVLCKKKYENKVKRDRYMFYVYKLFYLLRIVLVLGDY